MRGTQPVPTRLVGGFLGAGKTTLILDQLRSRARRTVVLVNEFGTLGIDGDLIRIQGGIEVVEMPGGCICCSQKEGLLGSIRKIAAEFRPELLLIEPSGVAETSELVQLLSGPELQGVVRLDAVLTVLDAETFLEYSEPEAFGTFFLDQVASADLVLVNKTDLVSAATLDEIGERVASLNPTALVLRTEFCRLDEPLPARTESRPPQAENRTPLGLECLSMVPERAVSDEGLIQFLDEVLRGRFGRVMRGKGFIRHTGGGWVNLQLVSGSVRMEPLLSAVSPRLTLIGFDLQGEELRAYWAGR